MVGAGRAWPAKFKAISQGEEWQWRVGAGATAGGAEGMVVVLQRAWQHAGHSEKSIVQTQAIRGAYIQGPF